MPRLHVFIVFFTILVTLFGLMQYYVYRSLRWWATEAFDARRLPAILRGALLVALAGNVLFFASFFVRGLGWYAFPAVKYGVVFPAGFYFATVVLSTLLMAFKDALRVVFLGVRHGVRVLRQIGKADATTAEWGSPPPDEGRRRLLRIAGMSTALAACVSPVVLSLATARDYRINRIPLRFPHLPSGLDGLTIAHVSDLHSGVYMSQRDMEEIFALTNSLRPDLIVLTGDFVDSNDAEIPSMERAVGMLSADLGVWGCLGNHDHFATAERVNAALVGRGLRMLNNAHQTLAINGERFTILGIDDFGRGGRNFARPEAAYAGADPESFKVMLSHRPEFFPEAVAAGIDLTLVGHTHGGQVGFELFGVSINPVHLVHTYAMGHYTEKGRHLYVNVGVGMVGAPIRLVRPEIALLTLTRSA